MASPDLIKNAARLLVGYFSLIDLSEAWITHIFFLMIQITFTYTFSNFIIHTLILL
jgi:hypothetical protein